MLHIAKAAIRSPSAIRRVASCLHARNTACLRVQPSCANNRFSTLHPRRLASISPEQPRPSSTVEPLKPWRQHRSPNVDTTPDVFTFFDKSTSTWTYLVVDPATKQTAIIDPVLEYDPASGNISNSSADGLLAFAALHDLKICYILETHAHADHLTGAAYIKHSLGGNVPICIGAGISTVAQTFAHEYGMDDKECLKGFDRFLHEGDLLPLGNLSLRVWHLPGHTPDHVGYVATNADGTEQGEAVFTGDSIFLPDVGTARADFPGGDAEALFASMQRLLALPPHVQIYSGHDYPGERRDQSCRATVADQRAANVHVCNGREAFLEFRRARDKVLGAPKLLHPSLQVNVRAGRLPPKDADGHSRLKVPVAVNGWEGDL